MKVLVTGGSGVVGNTTVSELIRRGHSVRVLSRNAAQDCARWDPEQVEPWPASITDGAELRGCADGCDVVLHAAGIVDESPPEQTFESVNVGGTKAILAEAEQAGVSRFIYVSSLGADSGKSPYHASKRASEALVENFRGGWIILRPGNVYGPGDDVVSQLLGMVRRVPVIPVIDGGDDPFQPVWAEDLAVAIASAVERSDLHGRILELAGEEETTTNDLLDRLAALTDRTPLRVTVPGFLARAGAAVADAVGMDFPVNESQITMLREGNVIRTPGGNALTAVFKVKPTTLEDGLKKLADAQPEQLPDEGGGSITRKRIWADITKSKLTPEELFENFRNDFHEATPGIVNARVEPGTRTDLEPGATITMSLPLRGNVQVRAQEVTPVKATLVTVAGHPLAGAVRFLSEQRGDKVRFETQVFDRPASIADWFAMKTVGEAIQGRTWENVVQRMIDASGGKALNGIEQQDESLDEDQTHLIEDWIRDLVMERLRGDSPARSRGRDL